MKPSNTAARLKGTFRNASFLLPIFFSVVVCWRFYHPTGLTSDGHTYLQIARNIQMGIGLGWQALWATPLPSLIIAGTDSLFGIHDLLRTAGLIAPVMGVLLTASVYYLAVGLAGRKVACIASLVTAVTPHYLWIIFSTEPEIYYTVFLLSALGLLDRAVTRTALLLAAGAGCLFCCAYLSRSEGFLIMVISVTALLLDQRKQLRCSNVLKIVATLLVAFLLTASPYLFFLKKNYGTFVISPKATYVLIWMKGQVYKDHTIVEQENEDLWGLTPGLKLKWQVPSGIGDLVHYLLQDPGKSARVYVTNLLSELPGRPANNSGALQYPNVYPVYLALLALYALLLPWEQPSRRKKLILAAPFLILFILPVFTGGWWKYLVPYSPLLTILATIGLVRGVDTVFINRKSTGTIVVTLFTLVLMAYYVDRYHGLRATLFPWYATPLPAPTVTKDKNASQKSLLAEDARKAGQWAAAHYGAGKNYMVPWNKLIYHLNGLWTALPVAEPSEVYQYALRNQVDLLVLEGINPTIPDAALTDVVYGFTLDSVYHSEKTLYRVAFFRPIPPAK